VPLISSFVLGFIFFLLIVEFCLIKELDFRYPPPTELPSYEQESASIPSQSLTEWRSCYLHARSRSRTTISVSRLILKFSEGRLIRLAAAWTVRLTSRRYLRHFLAWHRTCVTPNL
jgi:hypothetical protein